MAGRDRVLAAGLVCLALVSCATTAPPPLEEPAAAVPPQTVTPPEVAPSPPPPATEEPVATPSERPTTIVIDEGAPRAAEEPSLVAAAQAERDRRRVAAPSVAVVDDKNLGEHAVGRLTYTDAPAVAPAPHPGTTAEDPAAEAYWRDRVRSEREAWAQAVEEIERLENLAAEMRLRFYAEDDPFVRDGRIKPEWDRALASLEQARHHARTAEEELEATLEEGRTAGALPGWLREGVELEPPRDEHEERPEIRDDPVMGEPQIVDER